MKVKLTPVYFLSGMDGAYNRQLQEIKKQLGDYVELLPSVEAGSEIPSQADAVLLPVLLGEAYQKAEELKKINKPILLLTSEFMTIAMWDWELKAYFQSKGIKVLAPYSIELAKAMLSALQVKKSLKDSVFIVYQETPGDGMQPEIFKRFFWWEQECIDIIKEVWGIQVEVKSLKELTKNSCDISDEQADLVLHEDCATMLSEGEICIAKLRKAAKVYLAVKEDISKCGEVRGVGTNCLNESFYTETTPCLAWDLLYRRDGILWACEADIVSLLAKCLLHGITKAPVMMSNIYPFLMGMAAVKHEKIEHFPLIPNSEHYLLAVHCGYFGCMPRSFASGWELRPKVLEIVNEDSLAIDARYPLGKVTIAQLHQDMKTLLLIEGEIEDYIGYEGSDCRNAALVRVKDGYRLMENLFSHHAIFLPGALTAQLIAVAEILEIHIRSLS